MVAARTRVTPDYLRALRLATGRGAAVSFAYGTEAVLAMAGVLAPAAALWMCLAELQGWRHSGMVASPLPLSCADAIGPVANGDRSLAEHWR